jgi:hypothetical protein
MIYSALAWLRPRTSLARPEKNSRPAFAVPLQENADSSVTLAENMMTLDLHRQLHGFALPVNLALIVISRVGSAVA